MGYTLDIQLTLSNFTACQLTLISTLLDVRVRVSRISWHVFAKLVEDYIRIKYCHFIPRILTMSFPPKKVIKMRWRLNWAGADLFFSVVPVGFRDWGYVHEEIPAVENQWVCSSLYRRTRCEIFWWSYAVLMGNGGGGSWSSGVCGGLIRARSPCGMFIESRPVSGVAGTELLWACLLLHLIYGPGSEIKAGNPAPGPIVLLICNITQH